MHELEIYNIETTEKRCPMNLGALFIWTSWLYIAVAIILARVMYHRVQKRYPDYFGAPGDTWSDALNLKRTQNIWELITDDAPQKDRFDPFLEKMILCVKIMYFTAPVAMVLFVIGCFLR
jgi:hypothetical protein